MNSLPASPRTTLVKKLIIGYALMGLLALIALLISLQGLFSLSDIVHQVAGSDLIAITRTGTLRDSLLAQERYAGKFLILGTSEFRDLYDARRREFESVLKELRATESDDRHLEQLARAYGRFTAEVAAQFEGAPYNQGRIKAASDPVVSLIDTLAGEHRKILSDRIRMAEERRKQTVQGTLLFSFSAFLLASVVAAFFALQVSRAVTRLKKATHRIAEGEFDYDPGIPLTDEFGELAHDFTRMGARLKELEQISLDASPLTRLPGNIAIERSLNRRLREPEPFALCYADLDNFKAYNDRYGYIQASDVIKATAEIIFNVVRRLGDERDFVGHVGGDDFVMIVEADKAAAICEAVIADFGEMIRGRYSAEDLEAGYLEGEDRYGVLRRFPIMTISIAVLECRKNGYASAAEVAQAAAEIKDRVKVAPGSNYFIHRVGR